MKAVFAIEETTRGNDGLTVSKGHWAYHWVYTKLKENGLTDKWANYYTEIGVRDWNECCIETKKKKWAIRHGFLPSRILLYGLNEDNYKSYLSDFAYIKLHPLNNHFAFWINDKLTLKYIFANPLETDCGKMDVMPDYYLYIENDGCFSYLMDSPDNNTKD